MTNMSVNEIYWLVVIIVGVLVYIRTASNSKAAEGNYPGTEMLGAMIAAGTGFIVAIVVVGLITAIVFLTGIATEYNIQLPMFGF